MAIDKTVQAIFDKAMYLIDAQNESTGATTSGDTKEYRVRTIGILNNLIDIVYPASATYPDEQEGRPALDDIVDFSDSLDLDPLILRDVLPNGLAAHLLSEENPSLAEYFQQLFEEHLERARSGVRSKFESVDDALPYGGIEYCQFSRWF
jgi:hypothetical protein